MGGLAKKLLGTGKQEKLYVDDVFSTYLYTSNGGTQTINNGIDLLNEGGLVWVKARGGVTNHFLFDTIRGGANTLHTNNSSTGTTTPAATFNSTGYTDPGFFISGAAQVGWTFRRAPKFFDIVTYTGNGASNRQIAHELGIAPGFITTKATSTTGDWNSYHRSAAGDLKLNTPDAQAASRALITAADAGTFSVSGAANTNGVQYVAYLFAHDPSADGIVQCGSYVGNGSANGPEVNLGWEPQYLLVKASSATESWYMFDVMRGMPSLVADSSAAKPLLANTTNNELSGYAVSPKASGFNPVSTHGGVNASGTTYIYLAIRRPNKPPKTGAEVYNAIARAGTGAATTVTGVGFAPDVMKVIRRADGVNGWYGKLTGGGCLRSSDAFFEDTLQRVTSYGNDGVGLWHGDPNGSGANYINHFFKRAPGFMDVVCDTGTGAVHAISHNLTVAPELVIRKSRSTSTQWEVWHSALAATEKLVLNSNAAKAADATAWNSTAPGASAFAVGTGANVNANGATFVTYLFATLAGISKVGSYTGNGGSQTIDCGFTTGARFFLVKAINAAGSWWIYDSARGIVAAADPALQLNSAAAEITSADAVDPHASGIIVNQEATCSINASGVTYAFLAIA